MQIKSTMRYHLTLVRTTIIKKRTKITSVGEDVGIEKNPDIPWVQWYSHLWKIVRKFLRKLKIELLYDFISGCISKRNEISINYILQRYLHLYVHCSIMHNVQYIEKTLNFHQQMSIIQPHKNPAICDNIDEWMNLEDIVLSKISQTSKDKYNTISFHGI